MLASTYPAPDASTRPSGEKARHLRLSSVATTLQRSRPVFRSIMLSLLTAVTTAAAEASRVAANHELPVLSAVRPAAQPATLKPSATRQTETSPVAPVESLPTTSVWPSSANDKPLEMPAR